MLIKYIEYYIIYIYYFGTNLHFTNKKIFAEFYMNILNNIPYKQSYGKMIANARYVYHYHIMERFNFTDDKVTNVRISFTPIDANSVVYNIKCIFNDLDHEFTINYVFNDNIKNIINLHKNDDIKYSLLLYYYILDYEHILFIGPDPTYYKSLEKACIPFNKGASSIKQSSAIECFAGIFNNTCEHFYSLLDMEKLYGSMGNFFDNFLNDDYFMYLINPPYTDLILIRVYDMVVKKLSDITNNRYLIILYVPNWTDILDPFYEKLKNSNIKFKTYNLKSHLVYNHYTQISKCRYINTVIVTCSNFTLDKFQMNVIKNEITKMKCDVDPDNYKLETDQNINLCIHSENGKSTRYPSVNLDGFINTTK